MSRLLDLLLLAAVATAGWLLLRADPRSAEGRSGLEPFVTTVEVTGDEPLVGLGILLVPADEATVAALDEDLRPHQISPWQRSRRTQIRVPAPGDYVVRWGLQRQAPPHRALDVSQSLSAEELGRHQKLHIPEGALWNDVLRIDLPPALAAGLRRVAADL